MGKPIGLQFGQMVSKIQVWLNFVPELRVYHLYKPVQFTDKRPREPETGMEHADGKLPFQNFLCSRKFSVPEIFHWNNLKVVFTYFPTGFSGNFLKSMANNFSSTFNVYGKRQIE